MAAVTTGNSAISRPDSPASLDGSFKSIDSQHAINDTPASSATNTTVGAAEEEWTAPKDGPLKTPIPRPSALTKPTPQPVLTAEQETKYISVLADVSTWTTVPASTAKNAPLEPLQDHEKMFLTRECLLRYLRATKWSVPNALKRLQSTLSWRREYGADTFTHDYISPENETGKQVVLGYDNEQRPCLYLLPGNQNTKMSDRQIHHLCYMLDRTIDMMPPGVETSALIINFAGSKAGTVPTVGQARAVLNILQNHNPERLGKALILETPWYVNTFFKLISSFIDPVTREKMKFNENSNKFVPKEQLWKKLGGECDFQYDHDVYWPAFGKMASAKREAYKSRWESGGKRLGESEEYLRGGQAKSLQEVEKERESTAGAADAVADDVAKLSV
ncbi:related to phosphatidylinositol transfer protein PDR16 and related proteins [Ramularia collo-cygni]|uniref:Related to phosphatidylinositol transfer protein PDR16 and related proteins n=1 Tax=Ramularia collo-cygni TaxID=112498 RepID=A0A2D3VHF2_9PEZI|nr:related to phosphatidylinositol transfer protein PDR16 and related proteins [Ramularia collo-cygni]CZT23641.1 related to phosphatidylinositol transfer protein PDR16 and related proteins [Ramularia collo-cygni]